MRALKALKELFPTLSNAQAEEVLNSRLVTKQGRGLKKGADVALEDLDVGALKTHLEKLSQGNPQLQIPVVKEFQDFWVLDKPAGISSHPLSIHDTDTVTHWAFAKSPSLRSEFPAIQPTITPHRLDTGTSGLLIACKTSKSFDLWRLRFSNKEVKKTYHAVVWGEPKEDEFEISFDIAHSLSSNPHRMVVVGESTKYRPPIQRAQSTCRVLKRNGDLSLIEVKCRTGVTHQIRVHLSALGYPLVGDALYDPKLDERRIKLPSHQLRAVTLEWDGEKIETRSLTLPS